MKYYEESKSERINHRTAVFLTAAIYIILFTGIIFGNNPDLLPDTVKEWLKIEKSEEIKTDPKLKKEKKERA